MRAFTRLNTLWRAGLRESAERITDANALRIYRQEIADAQALLERRRHCLASLIANRRDLEREIDTCEQRVARRETQLRDIPAPRRTQEMLHLAAKDISATEAHLEALRRRHTTLVERIHGEELALRRLGAEIREHQREARLLSAEVARAGCGIVSRYRDTVASHLATLRDTRDSISGSITDGDTTEASMAEVAERLDGDPVEQQLEAEGLDAGSRRLAAVMERLRAS